MLKIIFKFEQKFEIFLISQTPKKNPKGKLRNFSWVFSVLCHLFSSNSTFESSSIFFSRGISMMCIQFQVRRAIISLAHGIGALFSQVGLFGGGGREGGKKLLTFQHISSYINFRLVTSVNVVNLGETSLGISSNWEYFFFVVLLTRHRSNRCPEEISMEKPPSSPFNITSHTFFLQHTPVHPLEGLPPNPLRWITIQTSHSWAFHFSLLCVIFQEWNIIRLGMEAYEEKKKLYEYKLIQIFSQISK